LFKQAKDKSPAIIFIDEIDAIGRARGKNNITGSNDERENTLNQLLTEMDGFGTNTNVIVIAATNRADVLDKALMRAGRFDRQIYVDLPDLRERKEIFKVHLKPIKSDPKLDTDFLAKQTPGFSGADIANVCNESALIAARKNKKRVGRQDFLDAVDRIVGGLEKKSKIITPEEKRTIAFHEAGHATVSWMLEHAAPLVKVTIVPRGQSLGAAWYLPEERQIVRTEQMLDEMCATLGGRAAEDIIFNKISTGALSDLVKVTQQARAMVTIYGLNNKIGNITYYKADEGEYGFTKPYSEETAKLIDTEISSIVEQEYKRAVQLLKKHKNKLTELAEHLLEKEVIFKDDLERIFGKRPFEKAAEEVKSNQAAPKTKTTKVKKEAAIKPKQKN
jgi:cell division protease FtsH